MQATQDPLILNESIYFDYSPPPTFSGHYNRHPFRIHITSSHSDQHIISLDAKYSRSYNPQPNPNKWSFLRPEYRFLDLSGNKINYITTQDTPFYIGSDGNLNNVSGTFIGVSGFAEFYFIDDIYNFDLAINNQPYTTIIATLQTSGINYFFNNNEYISTSYANSLATAYQPHIFYYRNPDYIKISENGGRDFINPRWSATTQPIVFTLNWNGNYIYNDVNIPTYNEPYNFCHYFPNSQNQQIQIKANTVGVSSNFNDNLVISYSNKDGYRSQSYCKTYFNIPNSQTSLGAYITASVNFDSGLDFTGNAFSPKIWISNPNAGTVTIAEYNDPSIFNTTDPNFTSTQFKNFNVPIVINPDYTKDNFSTIGFHGINSIAVLPPPDFKAWACDGELNYLYKFSTEGSIISAIDINQIVKTQKLGFFVENQVSPASITLDSNLNIWMTLYDTASVLKLDPNGNFLFALNPLSSINYTLPPNINYNWYLYNEMQPLSGEVQNFIEPTYVETDLNNNIWVTYSNYASGFLIKYDTNGNLLKTISYPVLSSPQDLVVDNANNVWVALSNNSGDTLGTLEKRNSFGVLLSSFGNITGLNNLTLDLNQNIWFTYSYSRIATIDNNTANITTINVSDYDNTPLVIPRDNNSQIFYSSSPQTKIVSNSISNINRIIYSLSDVPATTPSGTIANSSYTTASQQILAAKAQIQQAVINYAVTNYPNAMSNNPTLTAYCYRDTGFIVDALAADIANNTNHRSIEVGNFYYKGVTKNVNVPYGQLILPSYELSATINSINYIASYINSNVVTDTSRKTDVTSRMADVVYPLQTGGALKAYSPAGSPTTDDINIANLIAANRSALQDKVSYYVIQKGYLFDSALLQICKRDVGLIVDAIYNDLVSGVNARSIEYGLAYWNGSTTRLPDSLVPNHKEKTTDTFNYLNTCIKDLLVANGYLQDTTPSPYNIYADKGLTVPDEYTSETALEGIAADYKGNIYVINSVENQVYMFNSTTKNFTNKFYINPQGFNFFYQNNINSIDYNVWTKSAQAYGDWTGFRWINKYYKYQNSRIISLTGRSTNLDFYGNHAFDVFKVNENFDMAGQMKSLAFMPVLQDSPVFFDNFLGSIFGKAPFNHNDLGIESYEKIANFLPNNVDIDTCGIDELYNLANSVNQHDGDDFTLTYPNEIKRLMNLASINQSILWGTTSKNQNYFKSPSTDGVLNRGKLLTNNYTVSAGTPVILNTRSLNSYDLIPTGPINGSTNYPLSTLISYIGLDPLNWETYYNIYEFIPGFSKTLTEGIIDWNNPQTTITQSQSSHYNWVGNEQTLDKLFSYNLYNGLGLLKNY
jgi:hypothetical protein